MSGTGIPNYQAGTSHHEGGYQVVLLHTRIDSGCIMDFSLPLQKIYPTLVKECALPLQVHVCKPDEKANSQTWSCLYDHHYEPHNFK